MFKAKGYPRNGRNRDQIRSLTEKSQILLTRALCHKNAEAEIRLKYAKSRKPITPEDMGKLRFHVAKCRELTSECEHFNIIAKVHSQNVLVLA